jgi:phosphoglucomutase
MAAYEKSKGRSLYQKLLDLYQQYGYYQEDLVSITKKGMNGQQEIAAMMEDFRSNPPKELAERVIELLDYQLQVKNRPA